MKKICEHCNETFPSDDVFCPNCGKKLTEISFPNDYPPQTSNARTRQFKKDNISQSSININSTASRIKKSKKSIPAIAILLIALLCVVCLIFLVVSKLTNNTSPYKKILYYYNEDSQPLVYCNNQFYNNIEDVSYYDIENSSAIALKDTNQTLWLINENGEFKVDNDVESFEISPNGNSIVYTTSVIDSTIYDDTNNKYITYYSGYLKKYDCSKNNSEIIDNDVLVRCNEININVPLNISPNGDSICYLKDISCTDGNLRWKNYVYSGGISSNFTKQSSVYAINDDATICYWIDNDKQCIYYGNILTNNISKLLKYDDTGFNIELLFNKDCSECLATINDKTYIIVGQQEKENLGNFYNIMLYTSTLGEVSADCYNSTGIIDIDTFDGSVICGYKDGSNYYYISKNKNSWQCSDISNKSDFFAMSNDGKYMYGIKKSTSSVLHKTSVTDPSDETEIALHVTDFKVSKDNKYIYYIDDDNTLYSYNGKDSTRIDIDVSSIYEYNNVFYYIKDTSNNSGTLYCSYKGKDGEKVTYGNDVFDYLKVCDSGVLFISVYDTTSTSRMGTLYKIDKKTKAIKLAEDVYGGQYELE